MQISSCLWWRMLKRRKDLSVFLVKMVIRLKQVKSWGSTSLPNVTHSRSGLALDLASIKVPRATLQWPTVITFTTSATRRLPVSIVNVSSLSASGTVPRQETIWRRATIYSPFSEAKFSNLHTRQWLTNTLQCYLNRLVERIKTEWKCSAMIWKAYSKDFHAVNHFLLTPKVVGQNIICNLYHS